MLAHSIAVHVDFLDMKYDVLENLSVIPNIVLFLLLECGRCVIKSIITTINGSISTVIECN